MNWMHLMMLLLNKLHEEVVHLRQVLNLRKKGKIEEIQRQLVSLQKENRKLKEFANNTEEVERLKLENKIMRLELQRLKYEESSNIMLDGESVSNIGSISHLNRSNYEQSPVFRQAAHSEIERKIEHDLPLRCPLCNSFPPCTHYSEVSNLIPSKSTRENTNSFRQSSDTMDRRRNIIPKLARSRENLYQSDDNPYSINDINSSTLSISDSKKRARESTSFNSGSRREQRQARNEYADYVENEGLPKISSKMLVRNDPKFQSEYNFSKDESIILPQNSIRNSLNKEQVDDEFKRLMHSSQYSAGSESFSPGREYIENKPLVINARQSGYTVFPSMIEKPSTRNQRSKELYNAGGNILSQDVSIIQEDSSIMPRNLISSEYAPRSDQYPTTVTGIPTNSTVIRIRGKNNQYKSKKGLIEYTPDEEFIINSKRKDVIQASQRLKKLEQYEKKQLNKVKDEIYKLEEERKKDEDERKIKRKELLDKRKKLLDDRRQLELKRQKRLENNSVEATSNFYDSRYNL